MNHWIKLALPLGLGVVAGLVNWSVTMSKIRPIACVGLAGSVKPGDKLAEDKLLRIEIGGDFPRLTQTVIPWEERAILYGRTVPRAMEPGDLLFWRDATPAPKDLLVHKGEVPLSISLRGMTVVPDFLRVGQQVGFLVAAEASRGRHAPPFPRAAEGEFVPELEPEPACKATQYLGPFRILAVGTRTSPSARGGEGTAEDNRVVTVAAKFLPNSRQLDALADRLVAALNGLRDERAVGVVLHRDDTTAVPR